MKYDKLGDVHYEWCNAFENLRRSGCRRIVKLKPRGTFKTTIYDVAFVIDYLIEDWVENNGKFTKRILITSATDDLAVNILSEIREHLNSNEELLKFFNVKSKEELIAKENLSEVRFKHRLIKKEPNLAAKGALSSLVSSHYDLIICDDICYDKETEVLTNNGWKLFKDLDKENDLIATLNNVTDEIEYQKPINYIQYHYKGDMIGIKHKNIDFLVTPDHDLYFKEYGKDNYEIIKAKDAFGKYGKFKKNMDTTQYNLTEFNKNIFESCVTKKNWYKTNYDDEVYCIEVPNHTIYVRRNGKGVFLNQCNQDDRESAAVREKKKRWFKDLISILEPDGEILVVGTRWHSDDLYQALFEMNTKLPEESKYDIEIDSIVDSEGNLNYPSIYKEGDVARLKIEKGLIEFYAQYMNEALPSETQRFKPENFKYYTDYGSNKKDDPLQLHTCRHFAYVDPALGKENDYSVILVGAVKDRKLYIRDAFISNTVTPDVVIDRLEYFYNFYDLQKAGVETNGFQSLFGTAVSNRGIPFFGVQNVKKKQIRIDSIEPFINNGNVLFREDWSSVYPELIEQLVSYPVHKHDDCPDCLEGLIRMSLKSGNSVISDFKGFLCGIARDGNK